MTMRAAVLAGAMLATAASAQPVDPASLARRGTVDPRFQSYNIEMVEVTGGRFWKSYRLGPPKDAADRYAYRPPLDLANPRLVRLARALGPAYVRVSGTWANSTYFADREPASKTPPTGFSQVLTRAEWRGVARFLTAVEGALVLSFAGSAGARDAQGVWQPAQMQALTAYSRKLKMNMAAAAFINEPNLIRESGAPEGYTAADYARDFDRFATAFRAAMPTAKVIGPDGLGGGGLEALASAAKIPILRGEELMALPTARLDTVAYHHYGGVSERCATSGPLAVREDQAYDPRWLARTDETLAFYDALRDRYARGAPIWLTETGQAACGGSRWASTFVDTPRYLDQLGRLAAAGVQTVMHNTLAASDYALLDERDFAPRPSYWAALLWARLIGTTVLTAPPSPPMLRLYAHCTKGVPGGVTLLAINLDAKMTELSFAGAGRAFVLSGVDENRAVALNGMRLALGRNDALPRLDDVSADGGVDVPARSIAFVTLPSAGNAACR